MEIDEYIAVQQDKGLTPCTKCKILAYVACGNLKRVDRTTYELSFRCDLCHNTWAEVYKLTSLRSK